MSEELKRLFIYQVITPQVMQEIIEGAHCRAFDKLPDRVQQRYAAIASAVRNKASLCVACGKQSPLSWDDTCVGGCGKEPARFDWSTAITRYAELFEILEPDEKEAQELAALEEMANSYGLTFSIDGTEGKVVLAAVEPDDQRAERLRADSD